MLDKRRLHGVELLTICQPFDRRDLIAVVHGGERETGINSTAIDQYRTRAALAMIASLLRAGEMQSFAQRVEQRYARIDIERVTLSVDLEVHFE